MDFDDSQAASRRRAIWLRLSIYPLALFLIPVVLLFHRQHSMIYHPHSYAAESLDALPENVVRLDYTIAAGRQTAFYLSPKTETRVPERVWVVFSGNASLALNWLHFFRHDPNPSDAFLLVDYPGYGSSEGVAGIASTRASADAAVEALAARLGVSANELEPRLNAFGHSLGAAAALDFAIHHAVGRVVLIAPFTTLREEAALVVGRALSYLLKENYNNRARVRELAKRTPPPRLAIFHGTADDLIPSQMGRQLAESAPDIAHFFPVANATHDSVVDAARDEITAWMNASP